jgi:hypothetical protein
MSDQEERDRTVREPDAESAASDDPDVEGHRFVHRTVREPDPESSATEGGDEAEVEAHRWTRGGPSEEPQRWTRGGPEDDA